MALATTSAPPPRQRLAPSLLSNSAGVGLLVATDALAVTAAIVRFGQLTPNTIVLVGLALWALALGGHYRLRLDLSVIDDVADIAGRVVLAISLGAAYRELVSGHDVFTVDRLWVLIGAATFVLVGRAVAYAVIRWLRQHGHLRRSTIVIAPTGAAVDVEEAIAATPSCGLRPIGPAIELPVSAPAISELGADAVIVAVTEATSDAATELVRQLPSVGLEVYLLPVSLMRYSAAVPGADHLASLPLVPVRPAANRSFRWKLKRILDVVFVLALLPIALPIMAVAALGLALESGTPVLYRQERVGQGGRRFTMYKLRTIAPDRPGVDQVWSVDPATIKPVARFCRATSIDELPQLWNVLRGDMSLVGPRPERPHYASRFAESIPDYANRHRVPVGLTGLAQINGLRGDTSISARARVDNSYIDNWSLFHDVKILAVTITSMLTRGGRGR
ncbi:MAG: exopolysaccharide biosynthesis polyprenyl glycosylphosphotransferase [Actinomycetota bacterium]